jgi:hypothetical protein
MAIARSPTVLSRGRLEYSEVQSQRLAQLRAMSTDEREALFDAMAQKQDLPALSYHFRRHRGEFGIVNTAAYHNAFKRHIGRLNLRRFIFLLVRDRSRNWILMDSESGDVALYNETDRAYRSFFRPRDLNRFLDSGLGWWVEVSAIDSGWKFERWGR